ncbi:MAG: hypothetical protein ACXWLL_11005 [Myxococcaceae bacterium]
MRTSGAETTPAPDPSQRITESLDARPANLRLERAAGLDSSSR